MVLKLYGSSYSPYSRLAAVILHEKQVPFEWIELVDFVKDIKSSKYLQLQPFGQVPALDDDGFILYESRAIAHYIASKYPNQGTPLIPTDPKANALFHQAASVSIGQFCSYAEKIVAELYYKPMFAKIPTDQQVVDSSLKELGVRLDIYDQILSKQKYIAGDEITLADFYHIPYGELLGVVGVNIMETRPNVDKWFKEITSRPSWQAVKGTIKAEKTSNF